jgi:hypothetical protein
MEAMNLLKVDQDSILIHMRSPEVKELLLDQAIQLLISQRNDQQNLRESSYSSSLAQEETQVDQT